MVAVDLLRFLPALEDWLLEGLMEEAGEGLTLRLREWDWEEALRRVPREAEGAKVGEGGAGRSIWRCLFAGRGMGMGFEG